MSVEKFILDGQVAVLVSRGFGAGWYSWEHDERMLFDPVLVEMLVYADDPDDMSFQNKLEKVAEERYPQAYLGGLDGLCVHWVPVGVRFRIEEYDGAEDLRLESSYSWITA